METKLTLRTIVINTILFLVKIVVGIMYNSISLISDAFNFLTDIVASVVIHLSIKISKDDADHNYPFGHSRFQPIAAMIVAIIMCFLGIQIIIYSIERMISGEKLRLGFLPIMLLQLL